jgi:hypothetical protein
MERRQYSKGGDSSVGICHFEGAEGREAKCDHRLEIRWVCRDDSFVACALVHIGTFRERLYHGDYDGQVFSWDLPD